jgi:iron complex transport system substrate-binding protein
MNKRTVLLAFTMLGALSAAAPARAEAFPVSVANCFETATFQAPPKRAVVNDANMVQTLLDLGLADRMLAVSAIAGRERTLVAPDATVRRLRQFSPAYPTLEAVLAQNPDFMFAGWSYGFDAARGVSPQGLSAFGIATYTLRESCIRIGRREPMSMEVMYADVLALGAIFGVEQRALQLVEGYKRQLARVTERLRGVRSTPRVMYCGDCSVTAAPLSSGAEGMPALIATLAGGRNIFDDIPNSYVRVSWEEVVQRDPQWILVSDDRLPASRQIAHLLRDPQLRDVEAVRKRQFILVTYPQRSPSTRNVETVERVARALHPEAFEP